MDASTTTLIVLALIFLASFVIAYFASKTFGPLHTTLAYLVFLAAFGFAVLAAATLKIHAKYRTQISSLEQEIAAVETDVKALRHGTDDASLIASLDLEQGGTLDLRNEIEQITITRGRRWSDVEPGQAQDDGTIQVTIEQDAPLNLEPGITLFVFEQGPVTEGRRYLGELTVEGVEGGTVTLRPTVRLSDAERQRLADSTTAWSLYETMPPDRHDLFASLTDEELAAMLPEESLSQYVRHGDPATPDDPPERVKEVTPEGQDAPQQIYDRRLRDYEYLFHELLRQRSVNEDAIAQAERDLAHLEAARARADAEVQYRQQEKTKLADDLARFQYELAILKRHLDAVSAQYNRLTERLRTVMAENHRLVAELTNVQFALAERLDNGNGSPPSSGASTP
ncbi:MAG: hypothetical protein WDZ59_11685 [Pirellulales bacterium]